MRKFQRKRLSFLLENKSWVGRLASSLCNKRIFKLRPSIYYQSTDYLNFFLKSENLIVNSVGMKLLNYRSSHASVASQHSNQIRHFEKCISKWWNNLRQIKVERNLLEYEVFTIFNPKISQEQILNSIKFLQYKRDLQFTH